MKKIKKELFFFLLAGFSAVGIDLFLYYILLNYFNSNLAKGFSFLSGAIFSFVINKYFTFDKHKKSIKEIIQFSLLYSFTFNINVFTNKWVLENTNMIFISFVCATVVSTVLNFLGQKLWVFK